MFQPHQYSRTRRLLKGFATSFKNADKVILADIYAARDSECEQAAINITRLCEEIKNSGTDVQCIPKLNDIINALLSNIEPGDIVITIGAGDIWKVSNELVLSLK